MDDSARRRWLGTAIVVGLIYLVVGIASSTLAGTAVSTRMPSVWRLAAWMICAVAFTTHIAYEHFRLRGAARPTAWHASVAVALGALALALVANLPDLGSASGYRPGMLIALVAWPLLTAVPAFIVALAVAAGLARTRRRT